ncbi:hypothetical protein ACSSQN_008100, partial [Raoultella planticola]|uniref:hypothetical protein n=1 Tax=Raoultella planticola TaxID=575 RepID=UPI003FD6CFA0
MVSTAQTSFFSGSFTAVDYKMGSPTASSRGQAKKFFTFLPGKERNKEGRLNKPVKKRLLSITRVPPGAPSPPADSERSPFIRASVNWRKIPRQIIDSYPAPHYDAAPRP